MEDFYNGRLKIRPLGKPIFEPTGHEKISQVPLKDQQEYLIEGEVYNMLRHGRSSPPVPLLIIGIAP
ncbi:MAG: hypothetical protein HS132_12225 [Planctomycetia bacterium]|nr:hypothetical protein [Planctomycetia bacterium]